MGCCRRQDYAGGVKKDWKTPFVQSVKEMNVRKQTFETEVSASSKDLQIVSTVVAVNYRPRADKVNKIYQTLGSSYRQVIVEPTIQEYGKKTTAKYTAEELVTKREVVKQDLFASIAKGLSAYDIDAVEIFITDFDFSDKFNESIERKVTAEQNALKAKNDLKRVEFESQQIVTRETAKAKAIEIKAKAITQKGGTEYVALMAVEKWNGVLPTQMIPEGAVPFISVSRLMK